MKFWNYFCFFVRKWKDLKYSEKIEQLLTNLTSSSSSMQGRWRLCRFRSCGSCISAVWRLLRSCGFAPAITSTRRGGGSCTSSLRGCGIPTTTGKWGCGRLSRLRSCAIALSSNLSISFLSLYVFKNLRLELCI